MHVQRFVVSVAILPFLSLACEPPEKTPTPTDPPEKTTPKSPDKPVLKVRPIEGKKAPFNKKGTLFLETLADGQRRVLVEAEVCLREGPLELLMCRFMTKEHEAILRSDVDAQDIHTVLVVAKAKPGTPAKYQENPPKVIPPTGTKIRVWLSYEKKPGESVIVNARDWIRDMRTKKELSVDWVFAGSYFFKDPNFPNNPPYYMANTGDVISVANFNDSMLDLPIASSKDNDGLTFECWTERIPPLQTKVTIILEPILE